MCAEGIRCLSLPPSSGSPHTSSFGFRFAFACICVCVFVCDGMLLAPVVLRANTLSIFFLTGEDKRSS
jgi:hypothetical protein